MRFSLFLGILLLAGCQTPFIRAEYGYGSQFAFAKAGNALAEGYKIDGNPKPGLPLDGHYLSLMYGVENRLFSDVKWAVMAGPTALIPTRGPNSELLTLETKLRLTYTAMLVQPFIQAFGGVGFSTDERWPGEGTQFLFSGGGALGIAVSLNKTWRFDLAYEFYHVSNGAAIIGTSRPNAGYNTDMVIFGVEHRF